MTILHHYKIITLPFIITLYSLLTSCTIQVVGGNCQFIEHQEIVKITAIKDEEITLVSETGQKLLINKNLMSHKSLSDIEEQPSIKKGAFYYINIIEHTSGGCSPFSISSAEIISLNEINTRPQPGILYGSGFVLAELMSCFENNNHDRCPGPFNSDLINPDLINQQSPEDNMKMIKNIDIRSAHSCPASVFRPVLPKILNYEKTKNNYLLCFDIKNAPDNPQAALFTYSKSRDKLLFLNFLTHP